MASNPFSYDDFIRYVPVPRGTYDNIQNYMELLTKWQKSINLVSASTLADAWFRHVIDSAQLIRFISTGETLLDVGSGGGFPGLVLSIMGVSDITLVESDTRKIAFLREVIRVTKANAKVQAKRVEVIDLNKFTLIVARGFASLSSLLSLLGSALTSKHKLLLLKGKKYREEIQEAQVAWSFDYTASPSITDKEGAILSIRNISAMRGL